MANINFYLDKEDKNGCSRIYIRINGKGIVPVKISTGAKVNVSAFDKKNQQVLDSNYESESINFYLTYLRKRAEELLTSSNKKLFTKEEIKTELKNFITAYNQDQEVNIVREQQELYGKPITFIDLFAGAGGFSEGLLQAEQNDKYFDFLLGSDINENCELTHIVRYNHQLGLNAQFLKQDITEPDFLENLLQRIGDRTIDVVCGGPPCQSFSLAGRRKKNDKKDDLFSNYLKVIKALKPKYFVMENVKGILTKERGAIKELIIKEINSIINLDEIEKLTSFIKRLSANSNRFLIDCIVRQIYLESYSDTKEHDKREEFIKSIESKFKVLMPKIVDYKTSKTDSRVNTVRHGLNLLRRNRELERLRKDIMKEKDLSYLDNDYFSASFDEFLSEIDSKSIVMNIELAFKRLKVSSSFIADSNEIIDALRVYVSSFDDCIALVKTLCNKEELKELATILDEIRLYKIEAPFVANASNYGVPQNRERVLFIGCRNDQKLIEEIPATVSETEKVSIYEALYDLDFLGNNDVAKNYNPDIQVEKERAKSRKIDGKIDTEKGLTYAEWSKMGRLNGRFKNKKPPFYVKSSTHLENNLKEPDILHNHQTSKQGKEVIKRLDVILKNGDYSEAKKELERKGLASKKRNYTVLNPDKQSSTIMTIPDDYIHYSVPRSLTVREMARLQSFDDSFVFQGKRSTGGTNRKHEVPQYTLVGNAVPPLLARAVGLEILRNIS